MATTTPTPAPAAPLIELGDGQVALMLDPAALAKLGLTASAPVAPVDEDAAFELALAREERTDKTNDEYRRFFAEFRSFLAEHCDGRTPLKATDDDVVSFFKHLRSPARKARGSTGEMRPHALSASKLRSVRAALNHFYRYCQKKRYRYDNPVDDVKVKRPKAKPGLVLSDEEVRKILNAPGDYPRCEAQAYMFHFTAARTGSVRFTLWSDADFAAETITFDRAKGDKAYTVPMHPELKAALLRWRGRQAEQAGANPAIAAALADPDTAYIFLTRNGRPLSHSTMAKQYKWRARRAGVRPHSPNAIVGRENTSKVHPHAARRTAGTSLRKQGVDLADVADFLNHSDVQTTREHYAFTSTPQQKAVVAKLKF